MKYQQCPRCVMDGTAEEFQLEYQNNSTMMGAQASSFLIAYTPIGCNFCEQAKKAWDEVMTGRIIVSADPPHESLPGFYHIQEIKRAGKGKKYDCLIGLSGGADSSTVLHHAVRLGLRPLCFSVDNGWNSKQADLNVLQMVEALKVPFYRYVIDQKKFKELQAAFLQAGVKNLEIPTDHVLMAASYEIAAKYGIKYILSGGNVATESIMPESWGYQARDLKHIKAIYKWATGKRLKGLPLCSLWKFNYYKWIKGIQTVYLLDYLDYNRNESGKLLAELYGWGDVGEKHEESEFTKWFQNFYLFEKFGIDKRKAHYSSMIISGQMTRDEALARLEKLPEYPKLGLEARALGYPIHDHREYKTDEWLWLQLSKVVKFLRKIHAVNQ